MIKRIFLASAALILGAATSFGAQIAIQNNNAPVLIGDMGGTAVPGGNFVTVGSFDTLDNAAIEALVASGDPANIAAAFNQFGTATDFATADANGLPGIFVAEIAAGIAADSPLVGDDIFIVAGEGSGVGTATSVAIFRSTTQFNFDDPAFGASLGLAADFETVVGTPMDVSIPGGPTIAGVAVVPVPEPSSMLLVALGAALGLRRRR